MALCVLIDMFGFVRSYCVCVCAQVGLYELWVQCKPCCCSAAWRNTVVCSKGIIVEEFAVIGLWEIQKRRSGLAATVPFPISSCRCGLIDRPTSTTIHRTLYAGFVATDCFRCASSRPQPLRLQQLLLQAQNQQFPRRTDARRPESVRLFLAVVKRTQQRPY